MRKILLCYTIIMLAIIYLPIAMIVFFSFNTSQGIGFPFTGFTSYWYIGSTSFQGLGGFFNDSDALKALTNSVYIALTVSAITTLITLLSALSLRKRYRGRDFFFYAILSGLFIPGILYGLGTAFLYHQIDMPQSIFNVVPVQVVFALPFGLLLLLPRFDREMELYEDAAKVLGANGLAVFRHITFPLILYHVIGIAMFSFVISWGELTRSAFVSHGTGTLPVYLFARLQTLAPTPEFYAIGTIITLVAVIAVVVAGLLLTRNQRRLI